MNKFMVTTLMIILLTGCTRNAQLKAVIEDLEITPRCNVKPVFTHPKDTKDTLSAKVLILNDRVASCADWYYYFDKKLKSYKKF